MVLMLQQGSWRSLKRASLALGIGLIASAMQAESRPERIASLNLCTDQLLLALADRGQIASLSRLAQDPALSFMADRAAGLPLNDSKAEAVLFTKPDLVLTGTYGEQDRVALLKRQGLEVLQLGPWSSLEDGRGQIRVLARRLGHPERGEALIARIDAALERARDTVPAKRSILVYERGGWVMAARSPLSEVLVHMGFRLHQEAIGLDAGGAVRLETIVTAPPDFMLVDADSRHAVDNGSALVRHPALIAAVPMERRVTVPGKLTICGGPSTPVAIDSLAAEVKAKVR
jgi:iron complex transport system substrate-binding protein